MTPIEFRDRLLECLGGPWPEPCPRPLHLNFGENDGGSPIDEVRRGVEIIAQAYQSQHAEDSFSHYIETGAGHVLSDEMWRRTREFFARYLKES